MPVIYDPASYYGHAEADLGITHMFGGEYCPFYPRSLSRCTLPQTGQCISVDVPGFSPAFYEAYHSVHPRSQPYYEQRQTLYELYHHLNVSTERDRVYEMRI